MLYKKLRTLLSAILILLFFCTVMVLLVNILVQNPSIQHYLLEQLGKTTGYNLKARDLKLDLLDGIGFSALDLVAESQVRPEHIQVSRLRIVLDMGNLIRGRIVPSMVAIFRPRIELTAVKALGHLKHDDGLFFSKIIGERLSGLRLFSLTQGRISINGLPFALKDLECNAYTAQKDPVRIQVHIKGWAVSEKDAAPFRLKGNITEDKKSGGYSTAEMTLKTGKFPLAWAPWPACLSFNQGVGEADIRLSAALGGPVSAEGNITAEDVRFSLFWHEKTKNYLFPHLQADFTSRYTKKIFEVPSLCLKGSDFSLSASSKIDFEDRSTPHITLKIDSPFLSLEAFKGIFPTPFISPWVKDKIFPMLSGGEARLDHFSLNGTTDQFKHLRLPENRDIISTKIEVKEIEALKDAGALPIKMVTGALNIEKGALSVSVSHAVFGTSTVTEASMDVDRLYDRPTFSVSVGGLFDLKDLKQQENLDFLPSEGRQFLRGFENLSGKVEARVWIAFEQGRFNFNAFNGKMHCTNCSIVHKALYLPFVLDVADLQIDSKGGNRFQGTGRWGRSEFQVSGSTDSLLKGCKAEVLSRIYMDEITDFFWQGHLFPITYRGPVPCRATLFRKNGAWLCHGEVDLDAVTIKTDLLSADPPGKNNKADFELELDPGKKLMLNGLRLYLGSSTCGLKGSFGLKDIDTIDITLKTEKFLLEDLGIQSKDNNMLAKGVIDCSAQVKGPLSDPQKISVTGKMAGRDVSLALDALPSPVNDCHFELDFSEKDLFVRSLNTRMGESPVDIHGHLQGWDGLKGEITVNADYLNFSDFIPKKTDSEHKESAQDSFWGRSDIRLSLTARKVSWKSIIFGPLQAECGFRLRDFYLTDAEAQLEHGSFTAKGHVKKEKGPERIFFTSGIKTTKQPVEGLVDSFGLKKGFEGFLTIEAALSAKGMETKDLIPGLTGSADFLLEEGRVKKRRGVFFKILEFLSLQNIIKWRMPDFSTKGFYFDDLEAHVNIKDGTLDTDSLIFKSPVFNATAQGTVSLPSEMMDFEIWVQTLETMDSLVGKVPIIGYILTGSEKSPSGVLIYPLKVKGPWSDPKITSRVLKNIAPGIIDFFKRILLSPGRIFKEISENTIGRVKRNGSHSENNAVSGKPAGTD